jgi:hypothetical protein
LRSHSIQVCPGVISILVRLARLSPRNSRRMASVGMAAGIAATFDAPIAAVICRTIQPRDRYDFRCARCEDQPAAESQHTFLLAVHPRSRRGRINWRPPILGRLALSCGIAILFSVRQRTQKGKRDPCVARMDSFIVKSWYTRASWEHRGFNSFVS